jgi:hypothetical protein
LQPGPWWPSGYPLEKTGRGFWLRHGCPQQIF